MARERRWTPSHFSVQSLHLPHSSKAQSTSCTQTVWLLHEAVSCEGPIAGFPQMSASVFTFRVRHVVPPLHVAEQASQSLQWSQRPSTQPLILHFCVLQGSNSSLSFAEQDFPPCFGEVTMSRLRERWPPSQSELHAPQSDQSSQAQSTGSVSLQLDASLPQPFVSVRLVLQPIPPALANDFNIRLRVCWPCPQVVLHAPHSDHSPTWQSVASQRLRLQP
mmetsp:Transcript_51920/g.110966  ORF Transcript_51920/g.110966 Transcript_51920/m.110966 type:complete len:220 (-) Transcript_51920:3990-4649(-)